MGCSGGNRCSKRDKFFILSYPVVVLLPAATNTCFYYCLHNVRNNCDGVALIDVIHAWLL